MKKNMLSKVSKDKNSIKSYASSEINKLLEFEDLKKKYLKYHSLPFFFPLKLSFKTLIFFFRTIFHLSKKKEMMIYSFIRKFIIFCVILCNNILYYCNLEFREFAFKGKIIFLHLPVKKNFLLSYKEILL